MKMVLLSSIFSPWLIASGINFKIAAAIDLSVSDASIAAGLLPTDEYGDYNGSDLISWIKSHPQGIIHPSLRIGRERPGDPSTLLGLYVSSAPDAQPIEKGEIIAQIPWELMIHPGREYSRRKIFSCRAIRNLANELKLGEKSTRAPYVRYLLTQNFDSMPGVWSKAGQAFFSYVLDHDELPPWEPLWRTTYKIAWIDNCDGDPNIDPIEHAAYYLTASRDEDTLMVPIYDMANHSNDPKKLNTLSYKPTEDGDFFQFMASRKIMPGEQIYNSYNRCNGCSEVDWDLCTTYCLSGTPELFQNFGFVEDFPQRWRFENWYDDDDKKFSIIEFCLEKNAETGGLEVFWDDMGDDGLPDLGDVEYLIEQLERLKNIQNKKQELEEKLVQDDGNNYDESSTQIVDLGDDDKITGKMTRLEWDSIWTYHEALVRAMSFAIVSAAEEVGLMDKNYNHIVEKYSKEGKSTHAEEL